ncbi:hypothetical protein I552_5116 [Mycobacterium xenopi 3993]|nr:hypothetical protein I552_5116 [Mycobacterium xenopi 3993]
MTRIRGQRKFDSVRDLVAAMNDDTDRAAHCYLRASLAAARLSGATACSCSSRRPRRIHPADRLMESISWR